MPAAALASDTAALMPPTSSIAESPSPNENVMMNTPESEPVLPYAPMTLHVTSPPYLDARDADSAPESTNPDSIYSNLSRAYDNAIVLRNFITTETMAFIQLALDRLEQGSIAESAFLETQRVSDLLLAFWGSVDDRVVDVERRDLLKVGKYSERLDLMIRLNCQEYAVDELLIRMLSHTRRVEPLLNREVLQQLRSMKEPALESNRAHLLHLINALH